MRIKKQKQIEAMLLTVSLLAGMLLPWTGMGTTVHAAEQEGLDYTKFATKEDLQNNFNLENTNNSGKVKFGTEDGTAARTWLIAGKDGKDTLVLLSATSFGDPQKYNAKESAIYGDDTNENLKSDIKKYLEACEKTSGYFSEQELALLKNTTVTTNYLNSSDREVTGKLYLPDANLGENKIYAGKTNNVAIALSTLKPKNGFSLSSWPFWLRSQSGEGNAVTLADGSGFVRDSKVNATHAVVPASNLDLSSVLFASVAPAASSSEAMTFEDAFTLRYDAKRTLGSVNVITPDKDSVAVHDAPKGTYLVVQNNDGAWATEVSGNKLLTADEISNSALSSFADCKVWLEKTDTKNRITTATLAGTEDPSYAIQVSPDTLGFGMRNAGYCQPEAQTVTVENTGNSTVKLNQPTSTNYEIGTLSKTTLAAGETATFTVQPKAGLSAGTYNETIAVSTDKGTEVGVDVRFTVNETFSTTITPDRATIIKGEDQTLTAEPTGGSGTYTYQWYRENEETAFSTDKEVTVSPAETTTYKVAVSDEIEEKEAVATINPVSEAITVLPDTPDFGVKNAGYRQPKAEKLTVENTGNSTVELKQPTSTSYEIGKLSKTTLAAGETATFTVQPKAGLPAGIYNETIAVSTDKGAEVGVNVRFTVNETFSTTITPDNATITKGKDQTLTAEPTGGSGTYTYQWYRENEETAFSTDKEVTVSPAETTTYKVVVSDTIEKKDAAATVAAAVTATAKPVNVSGKKGTTPQTGDRSNGFLWLSTLALSGCVLAGIGIVKARKKSQ